MKMISQMLKNRKRFGKTFWCENVWVKTSESVDHNRDVK